MDEVPTNIPSREEHARRLAWFAGSAVRLPPRCPCCGCRTLGARAEYEICPVCFWEDDGQDDPDADAVRGGPNGSLSLTAARANYLRCGACAERFVGKVRPPRAKEIP
jgi:hypothetical protein